MTAVIVTTPDQLQAIIAEAVASGELQPKSGRYLDRKALGNSWAVNCARWIGERIDAVDAIVTQTGPEKSQQPAQCDDLC